ncbi:MAG: Fur family transcriptional regulator [Roseburia sp.]
MAGSNYATANRKKILDFLRKNSDRTVSVQDIDCYLKRQDSEVNLTTIYRYLDKLEKEGCVIRYVAKKGGKAVYQYVEEGKNCEEHLHLKCIACGRIHHLDCAFMDEISEHIKKEHGFLLQAKNSILYGFCETCAI